jgi:hypothetical protein
MTSPFGERIVPMAEELREHSFDELARELASGTLSLRKALKVMGAALFGGALTATIPGVAFAAPKKKRPKSRRRSSRRASKPTKTTSSSPPPTTTAAQRPCVTAADCSPNYQTDGSYCREGSCFKGKAGMG